VSPASEGVEGVELGERLGPGSLVNGIYRLIRCMGTGGMGEVWEALHERTKGRVALKLLLPEMGRHREVLLRFQREVEVTSGLNHPNIVRISDANNLADGRPFLVMEYLEGHDLSSISGPLPLAEVCDIVEQTARGLHAAHSRSIVHRDLKPANIFIVPLPGTRHRLIKILDFGISKALNGLSALTQTQTMMGTPNYMAPEQATGGLSSLDARADQFSLAAIAYELLTGRMAFHGDGPMNVLYKVVNAQPISFSALGLDVPPAVEAIVMRGLSKQPRDRFESVLDFGTALRRAANPHAADSAPVMPVVEAVGRTVTPGPAAGARPVNPAILRQGRLAVQPPAGPAEGGARARQYAIPSSPIGGGAQLTGRASRARSAFRAVTSSIQRQRERKLGAVVLGLLAIGVGSGFYLWWTNRPGRLVIHAVPADATILIDGTEVSGRAPFAVKPSVGAHNVSVVRPGYDRFDQRVDVSPGRLVNLDVALEAAADTGLEISSEPSGELVWLDGVPMPSRAGQARTDVRAYRIPPGNHRLEIKGDSRYVPWQQDVVVEPGVIKELRATLIPSGPAGQVQAADWAAHPKVGPSGSSGSRTGMTVAPNPAVRIGNRVALHAPPPVASAHPRADAAVPVCSLAVGTHPWSEVWIDGRNTGLHTPYSQAIPCGRHVLTFKRQDLGFSRTQPVELVAGGKFKQSWALGPDPAQPTALASIQSSQGIPRGTMAIGLPVSGSSGAGEHETLAAPKLAPPKLAAGKLGVLGVRGGTGTGTGGSLTVAAAHPAGPGRRLPMAGSPAGESRTPKERVSGTGAGPLSEVAFAAGLDAMKPRVHGCYTEFKVPGVALVTVKIGRNGKVGAAKVTGKFEGTPVGACVENAVKAATFPPSDGLTAVFPFNLP
jgi:hypothetical protein